MIGRTSENERGAILAHVAIALLGLVAFSAFVFDYGVLWVSRRQAQNAADAAAHAGAVALAFDDAADLSDAGPAKRSAIAAGDDNAIWGESPAIDSADVTFPACPDGTAPCIRADVYRDDAHGSALPVFFGSLAGVTTQGVRATATAQVLIGNATDCLKPWAVVDKWAEHYPVNPAPWTTNSTFDKYTKQGALDPKIATPDVYVAPTSSDPGTGFHPYDSSGRYTSDYGLELELKTDQNDFQYGAGWFMALALEDSRGGKDYKNNIKHCVGTVYKIGDEVAINTEPGKKVGPTDQAVDLAPKGDIDSIVNQDPGAHWDSTLNSGRGGVAGSAFAVSPRIVAIPLVNPDAVADAAKNGRATVPIANIMGFFVEGVTGKGGVLGRLITIPGLKATGGPTLSGSSSFMKVIALVR
jgi:hypothetical protein